MPVVFFGHGSPTTILDDNVYTRSWQSMVGRIQRPRAIVCISAHWYTRGTYIAASAQPKTIHDFGPLDPALFTITYPAPGDPELATRVCEMLAPFDAQLDPSRGFDHGVWTVLSKAYPEADIPVVSLSMDGTKPPEWHYRVGQALRPLREQGVLIVASGNIVHNLGVMQWSASAKPYGWADQFQGYILDRIGQGDHRSVWDYQNQGEPAALSVPSADHYLPILYALGASAPGDAVTVETPDIEFKSVGMASVLFSAPQTQQSESQSETQTQ